jgi:hypothetical protein
MKKFIAIALFLGSFTAVQAQEGVRLGVKGSFYSTWLFNKNVSDQNASLDYASSFGTSFGAQAVFMFAETYGMSAELNISSHNQKYDGYLLNEDNTFTNEDNTFTNEIKLKYIDIPVLFRVASPKGPYFEIGPQFSLLSGAKETFTLDFSYTDKDFKEFSGLFGTVANHHSTNRVVAKTNSAFNKILNNVIKHWLSKFCMSINNPFVSITF